MSNAWEGYHEESRSRSRQRRGRSQSWRTVAVGLLLLLATGLPVAHCQAPGELGGANNQRPGAATVTAGENLANRTLVIYNENDPLSRDLAQFYAEKRGIADDRVVALKCSIEEEISREEYDRDIATPLRQLFDTRGWWTRGPDHPGLEPSSNVSSNHIRFVALMRGMPLKIRPTAEYAGDPGNTQPSPIHEQNAASVDSELAVLGFFTRAISGIIPNPYFRAYSHITEAPHPRVMLVTRLDAPTGTMVRRMITDSLYAEKYGLWGRCYLDSRGMAPGSSPLAEGDGWISKILAETAPLVLPTIIDKRPGVYSTEYPMTEAAMYFGWYTENVTGPFTRSGFHFQPGAVACHLHSYSAVSVRDPAHHWVGPLLDEGAAATVGNVYEPYLTLTTHFDVFAARLADGFTLAESAYAATPGLSWMNVVIGDPLYQPGKALQQLAYDLDVLPPAKGAGDALQSAIITEGRAYWRGAQIWRAKGASEGGKALEKSARQLHSGRIYEGLGLLRANAGDGRGARAAFEQALRCYKDPADNIRVILDEAQILADMGQQAQAIELLKNRKLDYANQVSGIALDQMVTDLGGHP